jgi:serine/threonine protein kinase/tetratricopeptide (TPR) repeat protein
MLPQTLSHFRVLEEIGAGGMGVVYRAHDEQLDRDVALKVLPAGLLADESARRRFHREALAVAKLNHPNVGAVYEFGGQDGFDFLVMELVAGVALDTRLATGPLANDELLRLGTQLAEGWEAAHGEGIIHRDLKPGNLRLTTDGRLKILDFGLARMQVETDAAPTVTANTSTDVSGTLPYMAPEQLRGHAGDERSDVYSAGVVLYEMATGKRPFGEAAGAQLITAILEAPPSPPRSRNRHVPPGLESIILKALDKNPNRRYQSARELRVDLERLSDGAVPRAQQSRPSWVFAAVSAALLLVVALMVGLNVGGVRDRLLRPTSIGGPGPSITSRRSLAVLGFRNLSSRPEEAWMSTALAEMLTTEMAAGEQLRTISGEDVVRMKLDLALSDADSFGKDTLSRIRTHLGSDLVIVGSYLALGNEAGGQIRLDLRLQDTVAGETIATASATGTENELIDLISHTGAELRQKLGIEPVSRLFASGVRAALPANPEAARLYAEGLARLRVFEAREARELLEKAVAADPSHAPAHSALAAAWSALGYDTRARDEARQAFDRSADLSREERLSIEGRYHELSRDWPKAIDIYRTLAGFFPDHLDYGLRLSDAHLSAGQAKEALALIDGLRRLPPPSGDDARIDLAESQAAGNLGDFKRVQESASRAAAKGRSQGARLVVAQARLQEGSALERLGRLDDATAVLAEAQRLFSEGGDKLGAAVALQTSGNVLLDKADFAGARNAYDGALAVFTQLGAQRRIASTLNNIGNVLYDQVELAEARTYYERVLRIDREVGDTRGMAGALGNLANVLDGMGDLIGARGMQEQGLAAFREVGDKRGTASTLNNLGNLLVELGDLPAAKQRYQESLAITQEIGYRRGQAYSKYGLSNVLAWQGRLDEARAASEDALAMRKELKDDNNIAFTQAQLASIALEQRRLPDAERLARDAADAFDRIKAAENGAVAHALLATILLDEGKTADARSAAERAISLSRQSASRVPRFEATLASARVLGATSRAPEAVKRLESMLTETGKYGYILFEYQARLALGTIDMQSGSVGAGRARLDALEKEARARGFQLIAAKSAKARG